MEVFLQNTIAWIESSKYILLFLCTIIEGPIIMITSGFLYGLDQFNLIPMYTALVFGDFISDIGWYCIGRFGTRNTIFKYGRFFGITSNALEKIENLFKKHHQKILIISKLTMGLGFARLILIAAGIFKIKFKDYAMLNLIGGFIWTFFLVAIGYFIGNIYTFIPKSAKIIFIVVVLFIIIFIIKYIKNYIKKESNI